MDRTIHNPMLAKHPFWGYNGLHSLRRIKDM
jgi:hypothetical protein